jgi:hypothetical protein
MSNMGFDMLLELLKDTYPMSEKLPTSNYEAKKMVKELGLQYEKIDACKNDCVIYYKEYEDAIRCPNCNLPRWKTQHDCNGSKKKSKKNTMEGFEIFSTHTKTAKTIYVVQNSSRYEMTL